VSFPRVNRPGREVEHRTSTPSYMPSKRG
jgi:hypothetical protein